MRKHFSLSSENDKRKTYCMKAKREERLKLISNAIKQKKKKNTSKLQIIINYNTHMTNGKHTTNSTNPIGQCTVRQKQSITIYYIVKIKVVSCALLTNKIRVSFHKSYF